MGVIDRVIPIKGPEAIHYTGEPARKEGIFVGITAGATFAGALRVCGEAPKNGNILCMLPDTGERYLSTPLFANVPAEMTKEELEISDQRQARSLLRNGLMRNSAPFLTPPQIRP